MKKEIKIRQHDRQDCAAACLSSVSSHYGLNLPLITIREACGTSQEGTTVQGLIDAAPKIGLSAKGLKSKTKNIEDLIPAEKPVILHLNKNSGLLHFVVLYGMDKKKATVMDPEDGEMHRIPVAELEEEWTGYIVVMAPSPSFEKGEKRVNTWLRFKDLFLTNRRELIPAFLGAVIYTVVGLSTSLFLQQIIDKVLPTKNFSLLIFFGAIMFALAALSLFIGYFRSILTVRASIKTDCQLVMGYLNKLLELPISFFNSRNTGELNSRIGDAYRIRSFLSMRLVIIFISIISLIISVFLLFTYYWKLAALTLAFIPLYYLLYKVSDSVNKRTNRKIIESSAKFEAVTVESLNNIRAIKYFDSRKSVSRRLEGKYVAMAQQMYRGGANLSAFSTISDGITRALTFTVLIIGTLFVFGSELTTGEMVSFFTITSFFTSPVMTLIESNSQITEAKIAAERLFEIMDLDEENKGETVSTKLEKSYDINIENLSFSFPGRPLLLKEINCVIRKGKINAVVGSNGCGKSTMASLLMKGYSPTSGKIKVNGIDISQIDTHSWRQYITIVPQRIDLFDGTILENIVPNEDSPDFDRVMEVCRKVGLEHTIDSLPEGILCRTGEQACRLSGGEKQKVAMARALYRKPFALILDEATSSIDASGRNEINGVIKGLAGEGLTILMISHEKESVNIADNIIEI